MIGMTRKCAYDNVKAFVTENQRKVLRFSGMNPALEKHEDLTRDLEYLEENQFKLLKPIESLILCEKIGQKKPISTTSLTEKTFWQFVFSDDWSNSDSVRVTTGQLLDSLIHTCYKSTHDGTLGSYKKTSFDNIRQPVKGCMKNSSTDADCMLMPVKITFTYYSVIEDDTNINKSSRNKQNENRGEQPSNLEFSLRPSLPEDRDQSEDGSQSLVFTDQSSIDTMLSAVHFESTIDYKPKQSSSRKNVPERSFDFSHRNWVGDDMYFTSHSCHDSIHRPKLCEKINKTKLKTNKQGKTHWRELVPKSTESPKRLAPLTNKLLFVKYGDLLTSSTEKHPVLKKIEVPKVIPKIIPSEQLLVYDGRLKKSAYYKRTTFAPTTRIEDQHQSPEEKTAEQASVSFQIDFKGFDTNKLQLSHSIIQLRRIARHKRIKQSIAPMSEDRQNICKMLEKFFTKKYNLGKRDELTISFPQSNGSALLNNDNRPYTHNNGRNIFDQRIPMDFDDKLKEAVKTFLIRKEQVTVSRTWNTVTSITISRK